MGRGPLATGDSSAYSSFSGELFTGLMAQCPPRDHQAHCTMPGIPVYWVK